MKKGIAVSSLLLTLETMFCGIRVRSYPPTNIPAVVARARDMAMGMPSVIKTRTIAKTMNDTISMLHASDAGGQMPWV